MDEIEFVYGNSIKEIHKLLVCKGGTGRKWKGFVQDVVGWFQTASESGKAKERAV